MLCRVRVEHDRAHVDAAGSQILEDAEGLAAWPRLDMGCLYQRQATGHTIDQLGLPCLEGGSVAIRNTETSLGAFNCMIFYGRQSAFLPPTFRQPITDLAYHLHRAILQCVPVRDAVDIPIDLMHYASCIANHNFHSPVRTPWVSICGVAVLPFQAGMPSRPRLEPVYSDVIHPFGQLFVETRPLRVRAITTGHKSGIALLDLKVLVFMPE